ncbi:adhesion G protein-coupled receptor L4-like [Stylophora pistillata]|uniref:adhesion G protein-coupled receptor L4-like n=1 Tax=Stylophora pistillata TaxID=50429 RepID=UPI000C03E328|nr:adhesion G protein-coupled receptor L4-like [Stylophora pistillata]
MISKTCQIWATTLLLITLLSFEFANDVCNEKKDPCTMECNDEGTGCVQNCNGGNYTCRLNCNVDDCNQQCDSQICMLNCNKGECIQHCKRGVRVCQMECAGSFCSQTCNAQTCHLKCSGEECKQHCTGGEEGCIIQCMGSSCTQICDAPTCEMTRSGSHNYFTQQICNSRNGRCCQRILNERMRLFKAVCRGREQCTCPKCQRLNRDCMTLHKLDVITAVSVSAVRAISTHISTVQASLQSSAPLSPLLLSTPIPSSSSSSSSPFSLQPLLLSLPSLSSLSSSSLLFTSPLPPSSSSSSSVWKSTSSPLETIKSLENEFTSKRNGINVSRNSSLQEVMGLFEDFTDQYQNIIKSHGGQLGIEELKMGKESVFKVAVAFEKFALDYSKYHLNTAEPSKKITRQKMVLGIQKGYHQNATDFFLDGKEWQASINISSENFAENGSVAIGCLYKDLHELLLNNRHVGDKTETSRYVNTRIITAAVDPKHEKLRQDVILKFRNLKVDEGEKQCMFWSGLGKSLDGFSGDGCYVDPSKSNSKDTVCRCNHLTHFAVLVDIRDDPELSTRDVNVLEIITYIGLSLSITGFLLTITLYFFLTDVRQPLPQIRLGLSVSLGAGQTIFLAGINATENKALCITSAVLMQYFLMAAFGWMLVEGNYLYLFVVKVYNINTKMYLYHVMSWGFPVVMVAISLGIAAEKDGIKSYISDEHCWMSSANNLIWIFISFVVVIEVINILILARVIREMTTMQPRGEKQMQQIRLGIRACVVMIPLLGITWLFGLLSPVHKAFSYIFTILNSTQGFLIFILHCARNSQIREKFNRKVNTVFPSVSNGNSTKKSSQDNPSDVNEVRVVKLQSCNEFDQKKKQPAQVIRY